MADRQSLGIGDGNKAKTGDAVTRTSTDFKTDGMARIARLEITKLVRSLSRRRD